MVSDQTNVRLNPPLIRPFPSWSDFLSYHPQIKVTSDHTIPRPKWPLIIPSPDRSDLWSYHPQTEVTSDHTIVRWNQIPDPVILVWEHTVCVGFDLIRGNFRMAPQPGCFLCSNLGANEHMLITSLAPKLGLLVSQKIHNISQLYVFYRFFLVQLYQCYLIHNWHFLGGSLTSR